MLDYSRGGNTKKSRDSFNASLTTINNKLNMLKEEHDRLLDCVEEIRKSRASIIEEMIALLKENSIKLKKPLSRCNNEEIITTLAEVADELSYKLREEVKVAMIRIDERYKQIIIYGKQIEEIERQLSNFYVPENDYEEEVVISIKDYTINNESIDYVEEQALEESTSSKEITDVDITSDEEENREEKLNETVEYDGLADFLSYFEDHLVSDETEEMQEEEKQEDFSSVSYTLNDKQTFEDVINYVYEGQVSWYDIYLYGSNKEILDQFCEEYGYDIEDTVRTKGVLTGLTFEFPQQIKKTNLEEKNRRKMVA